MPIYQASGTTLASGIDTKAIVDGLVAAESQPITNIRTHQNAIQTQISSYGQLALALTSLNGAASALGSDTAGAVALSVQSSATTYSATPTAGAVAGNYTVQVDAVASSAKARSTSFGSGASPVTGGKLDLVVQGKAYSLTMTDGMQLGDVATALNHLGAPISATVLSSGTGHYLSLTNTDTGFPLTGTAADGLSVTETSTGSLGHALGFAITRPPTNASFQVDGLAFTRTTNTITDAIPGVTLGLKTTGGAEDLNLSVSVSSTQYNLQHFVDAYNSVMSQVQSEARPVAGSSSSTALTGDAVLRSLETGLQGLITRQVPGLTDLKNLASIGLKTSNDGTLSIDSATFTKALGRNPTEFGALFGQATTGIVAATKGMVKQFTDPLDGRITTQTQNLANNITALDTQAAHLQTHVDAYRKLLVSQFTAMESLVSRLKTSGDYLTQQFAALTASNK
jgi:flagellar hook-associated protein 2